MNDYEDIYNEFNHDICQKLIIQLGSAYYSGWY